MITELFVVGSFAFWALMGLLVIAEFVCANNESGVGATVVLVIGALAMWLFGNFNAFAWVFHNPAYAGMLIGGYIVVGVVWSLIKWTLFVHDRADKFRQFKSTYLAKNPVPTIDKIEIDPEELYHDANMGRGRFTPKLDDNGKPILKITEEEVEKLRQEEFERKKEYHERQFWNEAKYAGVAEYDGNGDATPVPQATLNHKSKITNYIIYWPWSMAWSLVDDVVKKIADSVYRYLSGTYQRLAKRAFKTEDIAL